MPNGVRIGFGIIVGIFAGGASIAMIEWFGHALIKGDVMFIVAVIGLGIAAFIAGLVANWIGRVSYPTWITGAILAGLSLMNVTAFKHPN